MKLFVVISIFFLSAGLQAASCCAGGGPRSFIQLNHLQNFEWAVASSLKDVYGRYSPYGEVFQNDRLLTAQIAFGAGVSLSENLEWNVAIPVVRAEREVAGTKRTASGLGDMASGFRLHILDSLYDDDWYPDIKLLAYVTAPTGSVEKNGSGGGVIPGTGVGYWESGIGAQLERDFGWVVVDLSPTYSFRFSRNVADSLSGREISIREGNKLQLSLSGTVPLSQRLSAVLGGTQSWTMARSVDGRNLADSHARVASVFAGASYFVSRFWVLSLNLEGSLPWEGAGMNESAYRTILLSTSYAIY